MKEDARLLRNCHMTERCLKTKLQLYTTSRNGTYILLVAVTSSRTLLFL
jgi:hypothetical protein